MKVKLSILSLLAVAILSGTSTVSAITINPNPSGAGDTDNVLFNDPLLLSEGEIVQGRLNATSFVVNFSSSGGNLEAGGGQEGIVGGTGNSPFTNLKFWLENGTFTKAVVNPDVLNEGHIDGNVVFTVEYIDPLQTFISQEFDVTWNGQNKFEILAGIDERIVSVSFTTDDTLFVNSGQIRLGGAAERGDNNVPEGGITAGLLGLALIGLGAFRRK